MDGKLGYRENLSGFYCRVFLWVVVGWLWFGFKVVRVMRVVILRVIVIFLFVSFLSFLFFRKDIRVFFLICFFRVELDVLRFFSLIKILNVGCGLVCGVRVYFVFVDFVVKRVRYLFKVI